MRKEPMDLKGSRQGIGEGLDGGKGGGILKLYYNIKKGIK